MSRWHPSSRTASQVADDRSLASWLLPEIPAARRSERPGWTIDDVIEVVGGVLLAVVLASLILAVA